jgi:hypothetical protein
MRLQKNRCVTQNYMTNILYYITDIINIIHTILILLTQ